MADSLLLDLMVNKRLAKYREKLKQESENLFFKNVKKSRAELDKAFDENQLKLIDSYIYDVELYEENINYQLEIMILNCGVQIGMQLQSAFNEDDM